jgi:hypothetical protein
MNKTATVLKITAIILNTLFLAIMVLLCIQSPPSGSYVILAVIIFLFPLTNLLLLFFSGKLLTGTKGVVFTTLSVILGVLMLLVLVLAVGQSGVPEPAGMRVFLVMWILSPLISIPAVILLRARAQKNTSESNTIICPHCGGDVNT